MFYFRNNRNSHFVWLRKAFTVYTHYSWFFQLQALPTSILVNKTRLRVETKRHGPTLYTCVTTSLWSLRDAKSITIFMMFSFSIQSSWQFFYSLSLIFTDWIEKMAVCPHLWCKYVEECFIVWSLVRSVGGVDSHTWCSVDRSACWSQSQGCTVWYHSSKSLRMLTAK